MDISNDRDTIDSREIIDRIEELRHSNDNDDIEELRILRALEREANQASEWEYGTTLIRDSYFEDYARELVSEIGDLPEDLPPYIENNIDWSGVATDLQQDYFSVDFDGEEYWVR